MLILPKTTTHTVSDAVVFVRILENNYSNIMQARRIITVMSRESPGVSNGQNSKCLLKNVVKVIKTEQYICILTNGTQNEANYKIDICKSIMQGWRSSPGKKYIV